MTDKEFKHLHLEIRPIAALGKDERIKWIRSQARWIEYPAATKIQNRLWDVFSQPRSTRMENILIFGESGAGKTALINAFKAKHDPQDSEEKTLPSQMVTKQNPIIVVMMPPEPNYASLYREILKALGMPYFTRNHLGVTKIQDIVRNLLQRSGTQLLLFDEINSLLVGTPAQQRVFLQHLRFISNDLGIALVCVGTPEARYALHSDAQLRRRFSDIELPVWKGDEDLKDFVNRYVQSLPLQQPSPVDSEALRKLLVVESKGITHYICKAIDRAAISAIRTDREMIDLGALQEEEVWGRSHTWSDPPYQGQPR